MSSTQVVLRRLFRRRQARARLARLAGFGTLLALQACSPAIDWREVRPPDWSLTVSMPCRPAQQERSLRLAGAAVSMRMLACHQGRHVVAVTSADVRDPALVASALAELREAGAANVRGQLVDDGPANVPGMTPHPGARRWHILGQSPTGAAVHLQAQVFSHGSRVYQASVLGPDASEALQRPLFAGLEIRR